MPLSVHPSPPAERRIVTALFADIAGFTSLSESMDPEPLRDLVNACYEQLVPCVLEYGGTVDKFMGDALMAVFGAPIAHENDAERAVRSAIALQHAMEQVRGMQGNNLSLHLGINTGLVLAGALGARDRSDYSVVGDAVNVASRLEEEAGPGEIFVGPDTYALTRELFRYQAVGRIRLRGRDEEITAYRLRYEGNLAQRFGSRPWRFGAAFVGREEESEHLRSALSRTERGEGGVFFVTGEAGQGKSRLVSEVRQSAPHGLVWLDGSAQNVGRDLSYLPFRDILQQACGINAWNSIEERARRLKVLMDQLFNEERDLASGVLSTLLSIPLTPEGEERMRSLDGDSLGRQLVQSLSLFVLRLAEQKPLVIFLDDAHWLDPSSLACLELLLPQVQGVPLRLCLAGRWEPNSPMEVLQADAMRHETLDTHTILLGPLEHAEVRLLVHHIMRGRETPALEKIVTGRAGGNPLFIGELTRTLTEIGYSASTASVLTGRMSNIRIPETLHGVIAARIDLLSGRLRSTLRAAAVIGSSVSLDLLQALLPGSTDLTAQLALLEEHDLLHRVGTHPPPEYRFKHSLIQEVAYEGLLLRERRHLHHRAASAIEELWPERSQELSGVLAYHFTLAEAWKKAQDYLLIAGQRAARISADPETVGHFQEAIKAHLRAHGGSWGELISDEGIDWFLEWTNTLGKMVRLSPVVQAIEVFHDSVLARLGRRDPRTLSVALVLARAYGQSGSIERFKTLLEESLTCWNEATVDPNPDLVHAHTLLGNALYYQDELRSAERAYLRAVQLAEGIEGFQGTVAHLGLCRSLSWLYLATGHYQEAQELLSEVSALPQQEAGLERGGVLINLAWLNWALGNHEEAERYARGCLGDTSVALAKAAALDLLGMIRRTQGDFTAALALSLSAMDTAESHDPTDAVLVDITSNLAEARLQTGALDEAERAARRALALVEEMPGAGRSQIIPAYWTLAGVALVRSDYREAERLLAEVEAMTAEYEGDYWLWPEIQYRKAELGRALGLPERSEELVRDACNVLDERRGSAHPRSATMRAEWLKGRPY